MKKSLFALGGAVLVVSPVAEQTYVPSPASAQPAALTVGVPQAAVPRTGTEVPLVMAEDLTTKGKKLRVGQRIHLKVADDVRLNGQVVIPAAAQRRASLPTCATRGCGANPGTSARNYFISR